MFEVIVGIFAVVVFGVLAFVAIDLLSEKRTISNMQGALCLITLGLLLILMAVYLWLQTAIFMITVGGKEAIAILSDDFTKLLGAVGMGTAGMSIITGGFSLIAGGKYELKVSSTEPISGVEIKK